MPCPSARSPRRGDSSGGSPPSPLLFNRSVDSLSSSIHAFWEVDVFFRQLLNDQSACASYLLGCKTHSQFAVVDPHVDLVDRYIALADAEGIPIVAVLETHVQADHVSGLPEVVARTGATAYVPEVSGGEFGTQRFNVHAWVKYCIV